MIVYISDHTMYEDEVIIYTDSKEIGTKYTGITYLIQINITKFKKMYPEIKLSSLWLRVYKNSLHHIL